MTETPNPGAAADEPLADLRAEDAPGFGDVHAGGTTLWLEPGDYYFLTAGADGLPVVSDVVRLEPGGESHLALP